MGFNDGREFDGKRAYELARKLLDKEIVMLNLSYKCLIFSLQFFFPFLSDVLWSIP